MYKYLTKEQADCLIEELNKLTLYSSDHAWENFSDFKIDARKVFEVIDQCTEKDFPGLNMNVIDEGQISINEWSNKLVFLDVINECAYLDLAQFKEFTAGVNKIVE